MKRVWIVLAGVVIGVADSSCRADCMDDAARFHHVNVRLVRAIATVESGQHANVVHLNADGSTDIGLMQINSRWLTTLSRLGVSRVALQDRCTNAYVGAWILSQNLRHLGLSWDAVGAYNAGTHEKRIAYARRVYRALYTMTPPPLPVPNSPSGPPVAQAPGLLAKLFQPFTWNNARGGDR